MVNRVIIIGNLTRDTDTTRGTATTIARMRIATNAVWRDSDGSRQESSEFHNIVAFGKLADICASYCVKGRRVYIEGRLRTREYEGSDGLRRHTTEIVAETMKLLDRPRTGSAAATGDAGALDACSALPEGGPGSGAEPGEGSDVPRVETVGVG